MHFLHVHCFLQLITEACGDPAHDERYSSMTVRLTPKTIHVIMFKVSSLGCQKRLITILFCSNTSQEHQASSTMSYNLRLWLITKPWQGDKCDGKIVQNKIRSNSTPENSFFGGYVYSMKSWHFTFYIIISYLFFKSL